MANTFLADFTRRDDRYGERSVTVTWYSSAAGPVATVLHELSLVVGDPTETFEHTESDGRTLYKRRWDVSDAQLPAVAAWIDRHESALDRAQAGVVALWVVGFRWLAEHRRNHSEFTEPLIFGVVLSRPRVVRVRFVFYDAQHYRNIKRHFEAIGLASLNDRYISPKAALL